MKRLVLLVAIFGVSLACAHAQNNQQAPPAAPPDQVGPTLVSPTNRLQQAITGPRMNRGGVFPALIHPERRPARQPGREFYNTSVNPETGRAEGVVLFSLRF